MKNHYDKKVLIITIFSERIKNIVSNGSKNLSNGFKLEKTRMGLSVVNI